MAGRLFPPLQYLTGVGAKAGPVFALTWGVLVISVVVIIAITALLAAAIWRRRDEAPAHHLEKDEGGQNWLWIGVSLSAAALLVTVVWTVKVLADIQVPSAGAVISIEITGRQFWWQVHYAGADGGFNTANEIHIPTGQPVRLKLVGGDVIHSFWVPQLAGKMDAIPGQVNETWLQGDRPGDYAGQCTEYCGLQHSKMLLRVIAQSPVDFETWRTHQLAPPSHDEIEFVEHCGNCHAVRGTAAHGSMGPDLSHLMTRGTLASGVLPNDPVTLAHWIDDPQGLKPGNRMPAVKLSPQERDKILAWLRTLT